MASETTNEVLGDNVVVEGDNVVEEGENQIEENGSQIDVGDDIDDTTPKTPAPTDGSICCKKIINGKTQYHWDPEEVCVDPESVEGEVVYNDFCLALGTAIDEQDDDIITEEDTEPVVRTEGTLEPVTSQ